VLIKKRPYFFLLLLFFSIRLIAQNEAIVEPQLQYLKRVQWGMNLNSTGLGGINFKYGWHKTGRVNNMIDFEFARIRHSKETRIYSSASDNPRQYTFGRLNMAFFLRTGYGQNIAITERPYKNAASLHFNYSVGVTTAILKPIYLDIKKIIPDPSGGLSYSITVPEKYDPAIHTDKSLIMGNSSFTTGLDQLSLTVGGYGRASVAVEWGPYPDEFKSLEAGVVFDTFLNPLPLMAFVPRDYYFAQLFIEFTFGSNR
jgi:hypothetical protein